MSSQLVSKTEKYLCTVAPAENGTNITFIIIQCWLGSFRI